MRQVKQFCFKIKNRKKPVCQAFLSEFLKRVMIKDEGHFSD